MYQTTNYLERRPAKRSALRTSTVTVKWSNPFAMSTRVTAPPPSPAPPAIQTAQTFPHESHRTTTDTIPVIQRMSSSEGYSFQNDNPFEQRRRAASDLRAAELMAEFELADEADENRGTLVREADFKSNAIPRLSARFVDSQALLAQSRSIKRTTASEQKEDDIETVTLGPAQTVNLVTNRDTAHEQYFSQDNSIANTQSSSTATLPSQQWQGISRTRSTDGYCESQSRFSNNEPPPSLDQIKSRSFDSSKSVKKTKTQQRIDLARAARMRLLASDTCNKSETEEYRQGTSRTQSTTDTDDDSPSLDPIKSFSFDSPKPVKKTKAQQRIDLARSTRMRMVGEKTGKVDDDERRERVSATRSTDDNAAAQGLAQTMKNLSWDAPKPVKKTKAQQRIDIARATRMRIVAEMAARADSELPSEVGVDAISLSAGMTHLLC